MAGPMPGMATDAEIDQLREARGTQADEMFLRLMVRHHRGGALMADAAARLADQPEVQTLARTIRDSQSTEIGNVQDMLRDRGLEPVDTASITMPTATSTGDRSWGDSVVDAVVRWWLVAFAAAVLAGLAWDLVRPARDRGGPVTGVGVPVSGRGRRGRGCRRG
jgi:hypothetical protein